MDYTPPPDYGYVQQVDQVNQIQDGINAASDAIRIQDEIARQIGHVAVQGTSQQR